MLIVLLSQLAVTPAGSPVAVPMPVAPVVACVIVVSEVFTHRVGVELAEPEVFKLLTKKAPETLLVTVPQFPETIK